MCESLILRLCKHKRRLPRFAGEVFRINCTPLKDLVLDGLAVSKVHVRGQEADKVYVRVAKRVSTCLHGRHEVPSISFPALVVSDFISFHSHSLP